MHVSTFVGLVVVVLVVVADDDGADVSVFGACTFRFWSDLVLLDYNVYEIVVSIEAKVES